MERLGTSFRGKLAFHFELVTMRADIQRRGVHCLSTSSSPAESGRFHRGQSAALSFGKGIVDFLNESLGRNAESLGEPEHHIQRGRPDCFFKPRNVAPLQSAIARKIRLAPPLPETPPGDDLGEAKSELFGIVQGISLLGSPAVVAVTIGPDSGCLPLTPTGTSPNLHGYFIIRKSTSNKPQQESGST